MRIRFLVLPLLLASPLLFAQSQQHRETTTVEVVQVPVHVMQGDHSVAGLTRADFDLFINGKRQSIDYFDVIDYARLTPEQARDPRQRRLYVLVFDLLYSNLGAIPRAQKAALKYINDAHESDLFCVAAYSGRNGLQVIVPFTRDKEALRSAVRRLHDVDMSDPLRLAVMKGREGVGGDEWVSDSGWTAWHDTATLSMREMMMDPMRNRIGEQLDGLSSLATRLSALEGVKHVVLLSGGHDNSAITSIHPRVASSSRRFVGTGAMLTNTPLIGAPSLGMKVNSLARTFAASGVFLDAIDVNGIPDAWTPPMNDSLYSLAHGTGGTVVANRNDLFEAMEALSERQRVAYVIGFRAPDTGRETNTIRVALHDNRGAELSYRPSYTTKVAAPNAEDGLRLADVLLNDIPQTGLTLKSNVSVDGTKALVTAEVLPKELIAINGGTSLEGEALIYIYRGDAVVAFQQQKFAFDGARRNRVEYPPIPLGQSFDLPPGHYAAKVIVRLKSYNELGFARADFDVK